MPVRPSDNIGQGPTEGHGPTQDQGSTGVQANLRILETTDLHVSLLPYDYFTDRDAPDTGLAQAASLVRALRAGADNCLLFDNGDFLQGNPLADWLARESNMGPGDIHPMIAAMNTLDYDAATLGNHEFDYGLTFLKTALSQARFPLTSANIMRRQGEDDCEAAPLFPPYLLLDRDILCTDGQTLPMRIGVIGFAPPQLVDWNRIVLQGQIVTHNIIRSAQHNIPLMRQAGADIIVALSHSGIVADPSEQGSIDDETENASVHLAALDGIDVVLAGHTHLVFPGPGTAQARHIDPVKGTLHGKPAVMAGVNGNHVGVIDLVVQMRDGVWKIARHHSTAEPVARRRQSGQMPEPWPVDAQVKCAVTRGHDAILTKIREPIGETKVPLHSYFALVAPDPTIQVVARAQMAHAAELLQHTKWAGLPVLCAIAPSKAGGLSGALNYVDIAPGPLQVRHAAELSVFPNSFCILTLTGADLTHWLEQSAGIFAQITPGLTDQPLLNPEFPCYNFDVIDGVTYDIDPSRSSRTDAQGRMINPVSDRVQNLRYNGHPVSPTQQFAIATNSYRVGGGGGFSIAVQAQMIHHSAENTRDILIRHLRDTSPLTGTPPRIWQFAALPGTTAWFDTAAGGLPHLGAITGQTIHDAGPRPGHSQRFTLKF